MRRPPLGRLALAALLSALTCLAAVTLMATSAWLIARAAQHPDASALTLAAVAVRGLALARALLRYGERLVGHDAVLRTVADLRTDVFDALRRTPGREPGADDVAVLVADVEAVQDLWLRAVLPVASAVVVTVAAVAAAWWFLPTAGLTLLTGLAAGLLGALAVGWWASADDTRLAGLRAEQQAAVVDLLHGASELLVHGGTELALRRADVAGREVARVERAAARRAAAFTALVSSAQGLTTVGVAVVCARAVRSHQLSPVTLAVLTLVALAAFEPLAAASEAPAVLRRALGSLRRVRVLLAGAEPHQPVALPWDRSVLAVTPTHRYPGRPGDALSLAGLRLRLEPSSSYAVVGGSGAGKSTLLRLLAGELAPSSGSVLVGGVPLSALSPGDRAEVVAHAAQEAHVFDSSLADNLRVGRPSAGDAELRDALSVVGLDAWAAGLPEGLRTPVGHRGVRLSGGERRRLCVARAWLSTAPVLLLDEPTEGLDPTEADALLRTLVACSRDRAVVLVTHRVVALDAVDEVLVLERGELAQRGTAAALRGLPGLFAQAWELQAREQETPIGHRRVLHAVGDPGVLARAVGAGVTPPGGGPAS